MTELGMTEIILPSRGSLYVNPEGESLIPGGKVHVRPMALRERATLEESGVTGPERVGVLIDHCSKLPNGIKHKDLLATDGLVILLALRALTFGPEYQFKWSCEHCNAQNQDDINLMEELNEKTPDSLSQDLLDAGKIDSLEGFDIAEPYCINLEDSKTRDGEPVTVGLRHLRRSDESKIAKFTKRNQNKQGESALMFRLKLQIVEMNGEPVKGAVKEDLINSLSYKDSLRIDSFLSDRETGIDMSIFLECSKCGGENERNLPMTSEFFRPTNL